MRSLNLATRQAMMAAETGEVFLFLLALSHPSMTTMYFVNNHTAIVSGGETYEPFPFDLQLPDDREDEITRVALTIDNVDRRVVQAVRSIESPATFTLRLIRAAEPDVTIAGPYACALRNVVANALTVTGDLHVHAPVRDEPFPQHRMTPQYAPALFTGGVAA